MDEVEALIHEYESASVDKDQIIDDLGSRLPNPRIRSWMLTVAANPDESPSRKINILRDFEYYSPCDDAVKLRLVPILLDLFQHDRDDLVREYEVPHEKWTPK